MYNSAWEIFLQAQSPQAKPVLSGNPSHGGQPGLLPGVKTAHHVDHVTKTRTLQQAACDHAAESAFAVHRERPIAIDFRRGHLEVIERPPSRCFDVARVPLALTTHVEHLRIASL